MIKIGQIGIGHNHGAAKMNAFRKFPELFEVVGVAEEDDPKNHNKEFVARRMGEYTDENGEKVFAEIAHKYGGEVPTRFDWGYALAWHEGGEIKVVSALATTGVDKTKIVDKISSKKTFVEYFGLETFFYRDLKDHFLMSETKQEEENHFAFC